MFRENEVVMLILGLGVLLFVIINKAQVKKISSWKILITGYCFLLIGWFATVLEVLFLENLLNLIEHSSYAASALLFVFWCRKALTRAKAEELL